MSEDQKGFKTNHCDAPGSVCESAPRTPTTSRTFISDVKLGIGINQMCETKSANITNSVNANVKCENNMTSTMQCGGANGPIPNGMCSNPNDPIASSSMDLPNDSKCCCVVLCNCVIISAIIIITTLYNGDAHHHTD